MTKITRRRALAGVTAAAAASTLARPALAQGYPGSQTIKVVVPYPPGGSTDVVGRTVAERLSLMWKTSVIVENVPGAGANVGMDRIAKGPTDGTSILIVPPNLTTNPFLYSKMAFDAEKDIIPLAQVTSLPNLLIVKKTLPVNTVAELIAYAKANPGKLNYASSGVGTTIHLSGELFKRMTGTDMVHVAYRGSAPAVNDIIAGVVDVMFDNIPSCIGQVRGGTVKALGITTAKRSSVIPDTPTMAEAGVKGYEVTTWYALWAVKGTPKEVVDRVYAETVKVLALPDIKDIWASQGADLGGQPPAEFEKFIRVEIEKWARVVKAANLKLDL